MNPWETEPAGYSPNEFYTQSKDKQGHSTLYHVRIPDHVAAELSKIVSSGKIPRYSTPHDIIRDAIVHRLKYLADNFPELERRLSAAVQISISVENAEYRMREAKDLKDIEERTQSCCEELFEIGDYTSLEAFIKEQEENVSSLREPYRTRILRILNKYKERLKEK
ncbi:MAG: hypothetical protein K6U74_04345 [Firmicutes bacterium]|nr:hypothetical protein [Bacillota bacterium]